ncbi:M16 family metallopeptidase [Oharaeibacter diazotrophicus]|uniref:Putative Zn-dependent peptidase n=1 Tax=Oharaeibacter diazotrophicus TaxID=1920512 RepID=A0A4V3CVQ7_9HYPH|nr:pitrilysin family protein [Oharaeibacter diazotrophicus]TDP83408.1 putative Zn-dependent peptidase [Oharaeibacter diazotrophicus]BBE72241.1 protease 3 precursor [Pleomorphomonas sp. SM30]GLS79009.1 peptidase M16 [Oharaeibacter diazotrophicus]
MAVDVTELDNGVTVVTHGMSHLASTALGVWVSAGSRSEDVAENGISHLLEHMAFKGTRRRSAKAIAEEIENVGGEVNAATSVESTSYYARVLAGDVPLALDILADILQDSVFDPDELDREKHVIGQEIGAALDTPEDLVFDLFQGAAFPDQPIGRPILGSVDTVKSFSDDALRRYLGKHYTGPRTVIAAAGKVEHRRLVRLAREKFERFSADPAAPEPEARYAGGEKREERDLMEAQIVLGFPGASYHADDYTTAQIASSVLGGGMSSRLFQEVREKRGLCYSIYSFHWGFRDTGLFGISAATGEQDVAALVETTLDEVEATIASVGEAEVARAKAQLRAGLLMTLESPAARAGQIARQIMFHGRPLPLDELVARIEAVGTRDVADFLARMVAGAPTLASIGPIADVPSREAVASRLGSSARVA